jgi:hypothetical protein
MSAIFYVRRILGLSMIVVGLFSLFVQPRPAAAQGKASPTDLPQVQNAQVRSQAVSANLETTIAGITAGADKPLWMAYQVDAIPGHHSACCDNYSDGERLCGVCRLEKSGSSITRNSDDATDSRRIVRLEQSAQLIVLLRAEAKHVNKIRVASQDCTLDVGGLPFVWITGARGADSVAMLSKYVTSGGFSEHYDDHLANGALTAVALHGDSAADGAMESFVAPSQDEHLRKQAAFWLGSARGRSGVAVLERMAKSDPSSEVRAHVAFAFQCSKEPEALEDMIRMAHDDASPHVRGQALFWLAQKAGQKAAGTIQGAIDSDPDTEVKKKAVFALSQLPKDEGVPKLIEVAQTNRNPEVRKQAMFWLGQSHDPRALDFFEKILAR